MAKFIFGSNFVIQLFKIFLILIYKKAADKERIFDQGLRGIKFKRKNEFMATSGKPGPSFLKDSFGRKINYLRLAVTDRCNLRCFYCMPEEGIKSIYRNEILTYEETLRLINIFSELGINKLRITGGEPFVRKGLINLIESIVKSNPALSTFITTNGILIFPYLSELKELGIKGINLSLDTLNEDKFNLITKRNSLPDVLKTLHKIIELQIPVKINTVVSKDFNIDEITNIADLARDKDIEIRFIEQMPFNGKDNSIKFTGEKEILAILKRNFYGIVKLNNNNSTADLFSIPGFKGKIGIIGSYSRSFCSTCNRVRLTPSGMLKTCLYDNGVLDLREMIRKNYRDDEIKKAIIASINKKLKDGFASEKASNYSVKNSMASIGG